MRAQCVLVATTLLHSSAKFHSFLYTGSKTERVNMESCYGGMSMRMKQRGLYHWFTWLHKSLFLMGATHVDAGKETKTC